MTKLTKIIVAVVAIAGAGGWFMYSQQASAERSSEARQAVKAGAKLLDVRTPEEFAAGHIEGAVNIPVQELERRIDEVGAKEQQLVVYCRSGNRSRTAKGILERAGYNKVIDLGAMSAW